MDIRNIVTHLKDMREKKGITQVQVAEKMRCTQSAVSKLESIENPSLDDLVDYANAIGFKMEVQLWEQFK